MIVMLYLIVAKIDILLEKYDEMVLIEVELEKLNGLQLLYEFKIHLLF
jgi:hypothetical protein